jgi:hypothetical protein
MAFESFKSIADVVTAYQITAIETPFIPSLPLFVDPGFRSQLELHLLEFNFKDSESAVCEIVIFPILAEAYLTQDAKAYPLRDFDGHSQERLFYRNYLDLTAQLPRLLRKLQILPIIHRTINEGRNGLR